MPFELILAFIWSAAVMAALCTAGGIAYHIERRERLSRPRSPNPAQSHSPNSNPQKGADHE